MSIKSDKNLGGIPTKPYDMVREGLFILAGITIVIILLAAFWGFPRIPPLTMKEVATKAPIPFTTQTLSYFSGKSDLQTYGPPYTDNYENAQRVGFICPACWTGVSHPLNAKLDLVIKPLRQIGMLVPAVATALKTYQAAPAAQQAKWVGNYTTGLGKASVDKGQMVLPVGNYGPVAPLMQAMLKFARAGLLEGALIQGTNPAIAPYNTDYTRAVLYMSGPIMDTVANHFDEQGGEWGMTHAAGPYPGAWWLWPYAFLYQVPAIGNSPNADLIAGLIMGLLAFLLIFLPVIPGLNRLPYIFPVYRVIWRDWYQKYPSGDSSRPGPKPES